MPSPRMAVEAGTDLLARARRIQRSWDRLLGEGALGPELPPQATAGMRPMIVDSWRRVLATGLEPIDVLPSIEADPDETRERWLEHPLGLLRHVLVEPLQRLAVESNSVVQVTDPSGLTLYLGGPEWLKARAAEMNLVEGARCSETVNGTNGVGTALATDQPVQVFAFEHFSQHHREWVCSGAPIHDRVSGRLVGVVDLSSPWRIAHPRSLELVTDAARTTEQCLLEGRRDQDARLRRRYGDLTTKSTDVLVNREGYVLVGGDDSARLEPLDIPENGGEIAMGDGSLAVAEPLGRGEAYLVRRTGPRRAGAARGRALERAEERAREVATKQAESHLRELAEEQAALRQVATLVAYESSPDRLVAVVAEQVARVFDVPLVRLLRYEPTAAVVVGGFSESDDEPFPIGARWQLDPPGLLATIRRTGRAARVEDYAQTPGDSAGAVRAAGMRCAVGSPIVVEGRVWGAIVLLSPRRGSLPEDTGARLADFTDLVATALANAESRAALSELAGEQAALRRVATLVARGVGPAQVFEAVSSEVAGLFGGEAGVARFDPDGSGMVFAGLSEGMRGIRIGTRWPLEDALACTEVHRTGRPARCERSGWEDASGEAAEALRQMNPVSMVAAPIVVEGDLWGAITVVDTRKSLPVNAEERVEKFTELVATAIANTESRAELAASEARARDLAAEQAALRRVATLVAEGVSSDELFAAVTREAADVLDVPVVALQRYEADGMFTMVSIAGETNFTVGSRWPVEDEGLAGIILATGRPARKQDYTTLPGPLGAALRAGGLISVVGVPIVVEGSIWGFMTAGGRPGRPTPDGTDERLTRFTELVATAIANSQARDRLAQLAYEQSALRRVATMVAREPASEQLFSTVAREVAAVLDVPGVIVTRYEPDGTAVTVGQAFGPDLAGAEQFLGIGTPMPPDPGTLTALVFDTHVPARVDDLSTSPGTVGEVARAARLGSGCAGPIVVNGAVWGKMCVFSRVGAVLAAGTEDRLRDFIELVATAIANYEARAELAASETRARGLADEQAALQRVATLVAKGANSEAVFSAVAHEVAHVFGVQHVTVCRYEPDAILVLSSFEAPEPAAAPPPFPAGRRLPLDVPSLPASVYRSGEPVRIDEFTASRGLYAVARQAGLTAAVGVPIIVDGTVWGAVNIGSTKSERFLPDAEERLARFTELVATSVSNATMREELAASEARASELADEQAALRRVATLVARGVSPDEIFSAVTNEMAQLFGSPQACVGRFEPDGSAMVVVGVSDGSRGLSIGSRWKLDDYMASTRVFRTGRPVRVERSDLEHVSGPMADVLREIGAVSNVGAPIVVEGRQWGFVTVTDVNRRLPADAEGRLEKFAELVATAIANAESRGELAASESRARGLAEEQASLRRVATLLAEGAAPNDVFDAVIAEVGQLLGAAQVGLARYENEHEISVLAIRGQSPEIVRAGARLPLDGDSVNARILRTGRSARLNFAEEGSGSIAGVLRRDDVNATVGAPVVVDGAIWGMIGATWRGDDQPPADAEERLAQFAELLATAVSNAIMREEVMASRARVIAATDDARRRIERDVHDGAQQRLVTLTVALRRVEAKIPAGLDALRADVTRVAEGLMTAVEELRELSRGIHPSILTEAGLLPALKALGRRSPVRVKLDVGFEHRLPDYVEVAAYYTVSEALTNAAKHAKAARVSVSLRVERDLLVLSIVDDGIGGADPSGGSGLTGLRDRIEALGGEFRIESPPERGTRIDVQIPTFLPFDRHAGAEERRSPAPAPPV